MHRVKITAPGWEAFNGDFCAMQFTNGISDEPLTRLTIDRMAAIIPCQLLDDDSNELGQAGAGARTVNLADISAPVQDALPTMTDEEFAAEQLVALKAGKGPKQSEIFTEEQLKTIADQEGIAGLRSIGTKWNAKERSINKLIFEIMKAQSAYASRKKEFDDEQTLARKKVSDDALAAAIAREEEISKNARNLTLEAVDKAKAAAIETLAQIERNRVTAEEGLKAVAAALAAADETPNAVDESGNSVYVAPGAAPEFVDPQDAPADPIVETK
jgi:hypothetical protein